MVIGREASPTRQFILLLQVIGMFPYSIDENYQSAYSPSLSVKLILWSTFLNVLAIIAPYYVYIVFSSLQNVNVGTMAVILTSQIQTAYVVVALPLLALLKSRHLASILRRHHLVLGDTQKDKIMTTGTILGLVVFNVTCVILIIGFRVKYPHKMDIPGVIYGIVVTMLSMTRSLIYLILFKAIFTITSLSYLQSVKEAATSATAAPVSPFNRIKCNGKSTSLRIFSGSPIPLTGTEIKSKSLWDTCQQKEMLWKLEHITVETTECKDELARYFLEITTLAMMTSSLMLISCGYAISHGIWLYGFSVILAIMSMSVLGHICGTGGQFTKTIGKAAGILAVHSSQSTDRDIKEQVYRLLMALGPLKDLEMSGWYKLDYRTFVSCLSLVVTYLVILVQIGGMTVHDLTGTGLNQTKISE